MEMNAEATERLRRHVVWRERRRMVLVIGIILAGAIAAGLRAETRAAAQINPERLGGTATEQLTYGGIAIVRFAPKSALLAMGGEGGYVGLLDIDHSDASLLGEGPSGLDMAWNPDGASFVVAGGKTVSLFAVPHSGASRHDCYVPFVASAICPRTADEILVFGEKSGAIVDPTLCAVTIQPLAAGIVQAAWKIDSNSVLLHELSGKSCIWTPSRGKLTATTLVLSGPTRPLFDSARHIVTQTSRGGNTVQRIALETGVVIETISLPHAPAITVMAANRQILAVGLFDGKILLYPAERNAPVLRDLFVPGYVSSIDISSDGKLLAVGYRSHFTNDGGVCVFERRLRWFSIDLCRLAIR